MQHLLALRNNLKDEELRLSNAKSNAEIETRTVWVNQLKKEIEGELKFMALHDMPNLTDDELLKELFS